MYEDIIVPNYCEGWDIVGHVLEEDEKTTKVRVSPYTTLYLCPRCLEAFLTDHPNYKL